MKPLYLKEYSAVQFLTRLNNYIETQDICRADQDIPSGLAAVLGEAGLSCSTVCNLEGEYGANKLYVVNITYSFYN